jgi:hypothetical protein
VRDDILKVFCGEDSGLIFKSSEGFLAAVFIGLSASFVVCDLTVANFSNCFTICSTFDALSFFSLNLSL